MNRFRLLAIAAILMVAFAALAQQPATHASEASPSAKVDGHLQMLSQKLDLTADQQEKLRPVLQQLFEGQQKIVEDTSLSSEQRQQQMKALHEKADKEARQFLNDDQKKKLDELERQPHH